MASLEATLEVAGQRYPLVHATFGVSQPVGRRGRAATKVRYSAVEVTLDVPTNDQLLAWAADPAKRQAASLTFRDAATGSTLETLSLGAAYCVGYREEFVAGADGAGAYRCALGLSDPDGFTMKAGGPGTAFVAPAAGTHGSPVGGGGVLSPLLADPAAEWAAARTLALAPARIAALYATYVARKKDPAQVRSQAEWWGVPGKRGGRRWTIEGCVGEYQADKLFAAQGHEKLNHGGQLLGLFDPPQGPGLDGVWRNGSPPPEYIITETKYTSTPGAEPTLSTGQMSNAWVLRGNRLSKAVGVNQAKSVQQALLKGQVSKRVLHIDSEGKLTQYQVDAAGKMSLST